jgi:mannosyltransferase
VPTIALIVVSLAMPMFLPRYLLFTTPGWALLAGTALARLRPAWSVIAILLLAALTVPVQLQLRAPGGHDQATRQAAAVVTVNTRPGDGIVYADDEPIGAWTTRDAMNHYLPAGPRPRDVLAVQPPRTDGLLLAKECPDIAKCLTGTPRLWIVRAGHLPDPLSGIGANKEAAIAKGYRISQLWYPTGLTVALLEPVPVRR